MPLPDPPYTSTNFTGFATATHLDLTDMLVGYKEVAPGGEFKLSFSDLINSINTSGVSLSPNIIPTLDASKIVTGTFHPDRIPALDASKIEVGTLTADRIPNLDASKITTGTIDAARLPNIDASKITIGIIQTTKIPDLDTSKITTGIFDVARIPNISAIKITSGTLDAARIPTLDASKIGTGLLDKDRIPNLYIKNASYPSTGYLQQNITGELTVSNVLWGEVVSSKSWWTNNNGFAYLPSAYTDSTGPKTNANPGLYIKDYLYLTNGVKWTSSITGSTTSYPNAVGTRYISSTMPTSAVAGDVWFEV